jgi:hypothetical protein
MCASLRVAARLCSRMQHTRPVPNAARPQAGMPNGCMRAQTRHWPGAGRPLCTHGMMCGRAAAAMCGRAAPQSARANRQGTLVQAGGRAWQLLTAGGRQLLDALRATGNLPAINHVRPARLSARAGGPLCSALCRLRAGGARGRAEHRADDARHRRHDRDAARPQGPCPAPRCLASLHALLPPAWPTRARVRCMARPAVCER